MKVEIKRPTPKQLDHILRLFNDIGIDSKMRKAWLSVEFDREIAHGDELTFEEASKTIERLIGIRGY